ncbi:hypothetical protein LJC49_05390 [Ruminococcaceae bacterium OttesenSCG-928-I18]|nr:hypothetical protein [Ruminococcaceae bacterium OttesenSCG-928-I18]
MDRPPASSRRARVASNRGNMAKPHNPANNITSSLGNLGRQVTDSRSREVTPPAANPDPTVGTARHPRRQKRKNRYYRL